MIPLLKKHHQLTGSSRWRLHLPLRTLCPTDYNMILRLYVSYLLLMTITHIIRTRTMVLIPIGTLIATINIIYTSTVISTNQITSENQILMKLTEPWIWFLWKPRSIHGNMTHHRDLKSCRLSPTMNFTVRDHRSHWPQQLLPVLWTP